MNNNININGINECSLQFRNIIQNVEELNIDIKNAIENIHNIINDFIKFDNSAASEIQKEKVIGETLWDSFTNTIVPKYRNFLFVWKVFISNYTNDDFNLLFKELTEKIEMFEKINSDISNNGSHIDDLIKQIELQLGVAYSGDVIGFFSELNNSNDAKIRNGWQEMKLVATNANYKKNTDEIYLKYRSKNGEADFVDFALDEIGNKFLETTYSSKYCLWYYAMGKENDAYKYASALGDDEWCAEFNSYVLNKSGNIDKLQPYLSCSNGTDNAKRQVNGVWHDAGSDYIPKRGDIFFNNEHTGIVIASDDKYIYTIEGNTPDDDGLYYVLDGISNNKGGYVNTRVRELSYVKNGYYSPNVYLNPEGISQSQDTNFSADYMNKKVLIQENYELKKAEGGHDNSGTHG